jgi:hypothetical protein
VKALKAINRKTLKMNVAILKTVLWMKKAINRKTLKMNVVILKTAL